RRSAIDGEGVDGQDDGRGQRQVLRLRGLPSLRADHGRRGSGWHHPEVAVQPQDFARGGSQRPYVATTEQVWALHDAMPEHLRAAVLLGAFAGLRTAETCALRTSDVDFMRGVVSPAIQWPAEPVKSETSRTPVPIPQALALQLSAAVKKYAGESVVADEVGRPC